MIAWITLRCIFFGAFWLALVEVQRELPHRTPASVLSKNIIRLRKNAWRETYWISLESKQSIPCIWQLLSYSLTFVLALQWKENHIIRLIFDLQHLALSPLLQGLNPCSANALNVSLSSLKSILVPTSIMGASGQWCFSSGYHLDVTFSNEEGLKRWDREEALKVIIFFFYLGKVLNLSTCVCHDEIQLPCNTETNEENVCLRITERSKSIVIFLAGSICWSTAARLMICLA